MGQGTRGDTALLHVDDRMLRARSDRVLRVFAAMDDAVDGATDEAALYRATCQVIVETGSYVMAWVGIAEHDEHRTVRPVAHAGFEADYLARLDVVWADAPRGHGPMGTAIRTGAMDVAQRITTDPAFAPWREDALDRGYAASIAAPLCHQGRPFGALAVYAGEPDAFDDHEARLLGEVARSLSRAVSALRARAELRRLNAELEERVAARTEDVVRASRAKDEFLASMSHELRTPLNAVLGLSEALGEGVYGPLGERALKAVSRIDESGRHLLSLINDILDIAKLEAGQSLLDVRAVSVEEVCRASLAMIQGAAAKKDQSLSSRIGAGIGPFHADPRRVVQILVNLLNNAVKFTHRGGSIGLAVELGDHQTLRFTVWDDGIGIAKDEIAKLFQPFVQVDASLSRRHAGTGLGLALVRKLVELHGGKAEVESTLGMGSQFTITLPIEPPAAARLVLHPGRTPSPPHGFVLPHHVGRVLLVDDDAASVVAVSDFLRSKGHDVRVARNGHEALAMVLAEPPDLVLMDVQMPGMDGLEAMRRIRAEAAPLVRDVPIVALTAWAMAGDRDRCIAAGADEYVTKPVRLAELLRVVESRMRHAVT